MEFSQARSHLAHVFAFCPHAVGNYRVCSSGHSMGRVMIMIFDRTYRNHESFSVHSIRFSNISASSTYNLSSESNLSEWFSSRCRILWVSEARSKFSRQRTWELYQWARFDFRHETISLVWQNLMMVSMIWESIFLTVTWSPFVFSSSLS